MPAGLNKATNYYNRVEAWRDWHKLATQVCDAGMPELVRKYAPLETFGWRKVDKCIAKLRAAFEAAKVPADTCQ